MLHFDCENVLCITSIEFHRKHSWDVVWPEFDVVDGQQQLIGSAQFGEGGEHLTSLQPGGVIWPLHPSPHDTQHDLQQQTRQLLLRTLGGKTEAWVNKALH